MPQRCEPCQEKAVEQTFVVDCSRLLSFAVGFVIDNQCNYIHVLDGSAKHRSQACPQAHVGLTCLSEPAGTRLLHRERQNRPGRVRGPRPKRGPSRPSTGSGTSSGTFVLLSRPGTPIFHWVGRGGKAKTRGSGCPRDGLNA